MYLKFCKTHPFHPSVFMFYSKCEQKFRLCLRAFNYSGRGSLLSGHPTPLPVWHRTLRLSPRQNSADSPESAMCAWLPFTPMCTWVVFTPSRPWICCEFVTVSGGRAVRGHFRRKKPSQMDLACQLSASLSTEMNRPHGCRVPEMPLPPTNKD